jgi:hypothetical protein
MPNHFTDNGKNNQENVAASGRNNLDVVAAHDRIIFKLRTIRQKGKNQMLNLDADKLQAGIQEASDKATGSTLDIATKQIVAHLKKAPASNC